MNIILAILFWIVLLACFLFWFWMLADCIHKKFKHRRTMIEWFILIIFTFIIGAVIYYFFIKKRDEGKIYKRKNTKKKG